MTSLYKQIQAGMLWDFHGGIHPPARKASTSQRPIAVLPLPDRLYIPLRQHIGVAGRLLVQSGDRVLKGQALTSADNSMALPVHAPTSGTVLSIAPHTSPHPSALPELTIILAPDGLDEWREREPLNFIQCDKAQLLNRIQDSGIAGMGGAGFPTHLKTGVAQPVDYLIINAVECEPYISADDMLMQEAAITIVKGIDILCHLLNPKAVLIGIEDDKPIAMAAMQAACNQREHYYVRAVPTKYPSGGEKQLIQLLTSKEVPNGRRPIDIGIVMQNVGTAFAIAQAVLDDHPLISRIVTVAGDTLDQPQNVMALLGTPVSDLLKACGFVAEKRQRVIMGGPMMGFTLPDLSVPVIKTTNCILAPTAKELPAAGEETDCIRCSACADACPATLLPQQLLWYSKAKDSEKLKEYNLADCIECGACAYVCPSEIPLVQYYRVAKAEIREQQREALKAEQAKARFEARNARLEKEKQQRLERNQQLAAAR
ncbi:MAG: electron transport complex subunit RsxC, partial [Rheinheimera sp.]|nr:electron transport complex subunit RsxC [Rheinheimera sp.]